MKRWNIKIINLSRLPEKIYEKIDFSNPPCWIWKGYITSQGYGLYRENGRKVAHRHIYSILRKKVPRKLVMDHLCRVKHCVNPVHLEPVTNGLNVIRGNGIFANNGKKTHCKNGHEFTIANTRNFVWDGIKVRKCATCNNLSSKRWRRTRRGIWYTKNYELNIRRR